MEIPQPADFFEDELILPSFKSIERISQAQQISRAKNLPNIFFIRLKKILMAFKNELPQDIVDLLESTPSLENCRELLKCPQARPIVKERFLV
jgi:hypothetical protein